MARDESNREDLLREATALVERIELTVTGSVSGELDRKGKFVVGFRPNGAASFFFGDDPVYQFNAAGELRRAFCAELLFKAVGGRLFSLRRVRQLTAVQLVSQQLTDAEQTAFITTMQKWLRDFTHTLSHGNFEVIGQVPAESDVLIRVRNWIANHDGLPIATTPRA